MRSNGSSYTRPSTVRLDWDGLPGPIFPHADGESGNFRTINLLRGQRVQMFQLEHTHTFE